MFHKNLIIPLLLLVLLTASCSSSYQKLVKSQDFEKQFVAATAYYDKGDYNRALQLFDMILPFFRGTDKAEKIYYYTAKCYFFQSDYLMANYYFKTFARSYPKSTFAEEANYLTAYCSYLDSPEYSLDQSNTVAAIQEIQLFINMFPNSDRIPKCNELMDELRAKLERKAYEVAKLYYYMEDFQAAITSFKNLYKDFPDTRYREEVLFLTIKAYFRYATNSVEARKPERFRATKESFTTFAAFYPQSSYMAEARDIMNLTQLELDRLKMRDL